MEKSIDDGEARQQLGQILDAIVSRGDHFVVEQDGEPVAAVVPIELYAHWKCERFIALLDTAAKRASLSLSEADALAAEAVAAVRRQAG